VLDPTPEARDADTDADAVARTHAHTHPGGLRCGLLELLAPLRHYFFRLLELGLRPLLVSRLLAIIAAPHFRDDVNGMRIASTACLRAQGGRVGRRPVGRLSLMLSPPSLRRTSVAPALGSLLQRPR